MEIKLTKVKCLRCGYEWSPRLSDVRKCANPKCRSAYWDRPKKNNGFDNKKSNIKIFT